MFYALLLTTIALSNIANNGKLLYIIVSYVRYTSTTKMNEPSWKQLSLIPESVLKASILRACGIQPPAAGVCRTFDGGTFQVYGTVGPGTNLSEGSIRFVVYQDGGTKSFDTYKDVLKTVKASAGTPTGDALRAFLHHYLPPTP